MSAGVKHKPIIDPNWPGAFSDPAWWAKNADTSGWKPTYTKSWTPEELALAARLLDRGEEWRKVATQVHHTLEGLRVKIKNCGGRAAFIAKYAGCEP